MSESGFDPKSLLSEADQIKERNQREKQEMLDVSQREKDAVKRRKQEEFNLPPSNALERQRLIDNLKINIEKPDRSSSIMQEAPKIKPPAK